MAVNITYDVEGAGKFRAALDRFDSGMQREVHERLRSWCEDVKSSAGRKVPVKTGRLRGSIYSRVGEWVAEVGADAVYALFVEFGTRYMRARPFLFPAVQEYLPRLESIICEAIDGAKREAGL